MTAHVGTARRPLTAHRQRRHWRVTLRYWRKRINYYLMAAAVILALLMPSMAQAGWRDCTSIPGGKRCRDEYGQKWVICRNGYQPMALSLTCRWVGWTNP